ncbi:MAG: hypothetical protein LBF91_00090 [Azoarcus sp.]|jgi:hypothetical protein|nr:hypothetical protein [Azoarcus sp.]
MQERGIGERDAAIRVQDAQVPAFPLLAILMIPPHPIYTCDRMLAIHTSKDPPQACPRRLCAPVVCLCAPGRRFKFRGAKSPPLPRGGKY